ncbi:MAG: acyl-CoA dehydrogenase family protein [Ideonella sp.]|nr:acyl-CoA dehydrogenase family protein [Ideonella sp.]
MDFDDTPAEAAFRAEVRAWLEANAEPKRHARDFVGDGLPPHERLAAARAWQARKAAAGYAAVTWPRELGGLGGTAVQQLIVRQEESRFRSSFGIFEIGLGMCLPTLMAYGSKAHKACRIRPGLYGEEIWCQMFSEPAAGSDVAGVLTRARPDGHHWVVNGQKVWTTGAQFSDFGLLLARTDPTAPKHAGLTMFFVDMKSPGIEVRPIRQMDGDSEFNEVFLTDVRVPDDQRLGAVGAGWKVALTTLMHERLSVGAEIGLLNFDALWAVVQGAGCLDEPLAVEHLADAWVAEEGLRLHHCRSLTALSRGGTPGPEQSIAKLVKATLAQHMATFALQLRGEAGQVGDADPTSDAYVVERTWTRAAAMRIAGGTDEILRNIIAERVLGLPEEARLDKGIPFNEIPR